MPTRQKRFIFGLVMILAIAIIDYLAPTLLHAELLRTLEGHTGAVRSVTYEGAGFDHFNLRGGVRLC